jgi:hypothetical protein
MVEITTHLINGNESGATMQLRHTNRDRRTFLKKIQGEVEGLFRK